MGRTAAIKRKRFDSEIVSFTLDPYEGDKEQFRSELYRLFSEGALCDVTFNVRGTLFRAHRVVLVASSSFLGAIIAAGMSESRLESIDLDADPQLFRFLLDYIYGQSISISSTQLIPLLSLCSSYSMIGLRNSVAQLLAGNLTVDNCCAILSVADSFACQELRQQALDFVFRYFTVTTKTAGFLDLPLDMVEAIISSDEISDCDEASVFETVTRWLSHHKCDQDVTGKLLQLVRFPLMDSCFLSDVIKHHALMAGSPSLLMEAFEHHALLACGREGIKSTRTRRRRQSCSFKQARPLVGHSDAVSCLLVLDDVLVSGSWDSSIKVWSLVTWQCLRSLSDHTGAVRSLCVCGDKVVSCSDDGVIKVWSPGSWTCVRTMDGHDGAANALLYCRNRLASAGDDGTVKLWSTQTWTCEVTVHHAPEGHPPRVDEEDDDHGEGGIPRVGVLSLEAFEDKLVTGADDAMVRVWNTNTWTCEHAIRAHRDEVWTIKRFGGQLITGSIDGTLKVWSLASLGVAQDTEEPSSREWVCHHTINCDGPVYVACCLDNKVVSAGATANISVWKPPIHEYEDWSQLTAFETSNTDVWTLAQSKGCLISGSVDGVVRVWT